jgi:hypothetical protein
MGETTCSKCGKVIRLDDCKQPQRPWVRTPKYQLIILVLLLAVVGGVWGFVGAGLARHFNQWIEYIGGEPRASTVDRSDFTLYECHGDDTVRIVAVLNISDIAGKHIIMAGPCMLSYNGILSVDFINSQLVNQSASEQAYRDYICYYYNYFINVSGSPCGYDILTVEGYLHFRETDRLLSVGCDPYHYFDQTVIAVAIPQTANVTSIVDYSPYRHIVLDDWDIFYYDVTDISKHVSIHISYEPNGDAPKLDWAEVEAAR